MRYIEHQCQSPTRNSRLQLQVNHRIVRGCITHQYPPPGPNGRIRAKHLVFSINAHNVGKIVGENIGTDLPKAQDSLPKAMTGKLYNLWSDRIRAEQVQSPSQPRQNNPVSSASTHSASQCTSHLLGSCAKWCMGVS